MSHSMVPRGYAPLAPTYTETQALARQTARITVIGETTKRAMDELGAIHERASQLKATTLANDATSFMALLANGVDEGLLAEAAQGTMGYLMAMRQLELRAGAHLINEVETIPPYEIAPPTNFDRLVARIRAK